MDGSSSSSATLWTCSDDLDDLIVIDPTLASQDTLNQSDSFPSINSEKRKLDSWIYQHGTLEREGKKRFWICSHCIFLYLIIF
jgi:hypothetical protein